MKILGIKEFSGHDTSIAVVEDGKVIVATEEERFSRQKHHNGFYRGGSAPNKAIDWCIKELGLKRIQDFDKIVLAWDINKEKWKNHKRELLNFHHKCGNRLDQSEQEAIELIDRYS